MTIASRIPFTLAMALVIVLAAVASGTWQHAIDPQTLARWGFGLHDFGEGDWYSILTSVFLTNRPVMFWGVLGFVFFSIGLYEWRTSTRQALLVYWLTDLGSTTLITFALVLPLYLMHTAAGERLAFADDVGMSAGGFGCLGAWVQALPRRYGKWAAAATLVYLLVRIVFFTQLFADAVHLVAFPCGFWLDRLLPVQRRSAARCP